jgi:hypothetical protein
MTLEQRLERLERESRWIKRIGMMAAAVAAAVFLVGQGKDRELPDLEVRSLTVKDEAGRVRLKMSTSADGTPQLRLDDHAGNARATLAVAANGSPQLVLADVSGRTRVALRMDENGAGSLRFYSSAGKRLAYLDTQQDEPCLVFFDSTGRCRAQLGLSRTHRPYLEFWDEDGRSRCNLLLGADHEATFAIRDSKNLRLCLGMTECRLVGIDRKTGVLNKEFTYGLQLFDSKGKELWQAPR